MSDSWGLVKGFLGTRRVGLLAGVRTCPHGTSCHGEKKEAVPMAWKTMFATKTGFYVIFLVGLVCVVSAALLFDMTLLGHGVGVVLYVGLMWLVQRLV